MLVPYPATPQAGLAGAVNPAGATVEVTEVVKVARGIPEAAEKLQAEWNKLAEKLQSSS